MRNSWTNAKLLLIAGALCSGVAFALIFVTDAPFVKGIIKEHQQQKIASVMGSALADPSALRFSMKDATALSVLSGEDLMQAVGHISDKREIVADLSVKKMTVLDGPVVIAEFPILSIGREGTFWETPAGVYAVKTKEEKHLSSIGGTWMPWSMQFYGNFFIHGWPTYKDGTPVPKGYSGGCIRLSTEDAEKLYALVSVGTPVHVKGATRGEQLLKEESKFYMKDGDVLPEVNALSFAVFDIESGQVLWSKSLDAKINPGRLSSLMTALVSVETIDQYKYINFEALLAGKNPSRGKASDPSSVQVGALLYPLLFDASDIAAKALVELQGKKQFTNDMNEKARAIGMSDSLWAGGMSSASSTTTARDLARFVVYIEKQKSFLFKATTAKDWAFEHEGEIRFSWKNKNEWIHDATFAGGVLSREYKNEGGALALYTLPVSEFGERKIGFVILGAPSVEEELHTIKSYAEQHFFYGSTLAAEEYYKDETKMEEDHLSVVKDEVVK